MKAEKEQTNPVQIMLPRFGIAIALGNASYKTLTVYRANQV